MYFLKIQQKQQDCKGHGKVTDNSSGVRDIKQDA